MSKINEDDVHSKITVFAPSGPEEQNQEAGNESSLQPHNGYLTSWRLAIVIISLCLGTFLMALDVNIIGVAVPAISTAFHSLDDVAWYGSAYLLTVTAFQPILGFAYKFFNVRATYLISIGTFEGKYFSLLKVPQPAKALKLIDRKHLVVGSILCAAAPNSPTFIVGRALAGLGAAGSLQGALCIIGYVVELEKRPLYMGIVISVFGIFICVGPVLGDGASGCIGVLVFTDIFSY